MSVTVCCYYFKDTIINCQQRDIKCSSSKIKHQDIFLSFFLVQSISNCSSSGLIDDSHHIETSNGSGILCGLTLSIVEVSRYCDNSVCNLLAKVSFSNFL